MASITKVEIWEDVAGNVIGLVFDPAGQLTNAVQNLGAQQPLPCPALVEAARQAFPFAPTYDPHAFGERSLADLYVYLQAYNHHIADILPEAPTALFRNVLPLQGCSSLFAGCSKGVNLCRISITS